VLLVVAAMFVATAGYTIGESGVGALFFERVGADALPTIYLAQGATGLAAMLVLTGTMGRADPRRAYVVIPLLAAAVILLERVAVGIDVGGIYQVLWLTTAVVMLAQAVFLWGTAGAVTDTRRAKRLFPLFAAGGILGSVVGGLGTGPLAGWIGTENLLIVWAGAMVGTAVLCASVLGVGRAADRPRARGPSPLRQIALGFAFVRRSPLLMWMTAAAVLFSVLFFSLYLPFAQAATVRYPDPDELAGFLGVYWAGVTAAAFVVSVLLANRLLAWFGAGTLIVVLPLLYAGSFGLLLATTTFTTVVSTRFAVNVWLQGVASPAWETLVNVVPEGRRDQTRAFLNGGPTQVGTAIAGLLQLVGQRVLSARQLSLVGLVAAAVTVVVARKIRHSYARALVDALRMGRPVVFERGGLVGVPVLVERDAQAIDSALVAARSPDARIRRLGVEMLAETGDVAVRDALEAASADEDAAVRAHAMTGLGKLREPDDPGSIERGLGDEDPIVRRAAVRALGSSASRDHATLLFDDEPAVAAAAAVALLRTDARDEAVARLHALLADPDPAIRTATLVELRLAAPGDVRSLVSASPDGQTSTVRGALLETLAAADPEAAIAASLESVRSEDAIVRSAALHVLSELDLRDHATDVRRLAEEYTVMAVTDSELAASIPARDEATLLLRDAVVERGRERAVVALSALALLSEDRALIRAALENLDAGDPLQLSNALEALEVTTDPALLRPMLALWEAMPVPPALAGSTWLARASTDDDPVVRACAELVAEEHDRRAGPDQTARSQGDVMPKSRTSMLPTERVLELRKIPLFAALSAADLLRLASVAEERVYGDGDVLASEGELGDELHVVVEGTIRVTHADGSVLARRGRGDVVGEMSVITRRPRIASLVADGDVRTIRIGSREFESMIRERPEIALAIMRVLAERLSAETASRSSG
jgi:HEAT repeat protein